MPILAFFAKIIAKNIMFESRNFRMNFEVRGKSHMTWQFNFSWVSTFCAPEFAIIIVVKVRYGYRTTFFAELFLKGSSSRESKMFRKKNENDCLFTYLSNFLNRIRNRSLSFCKNPQGPKFVPKITQEIVDQIVAKIAPKIVPFKISFLEKYVILKFIYSEKATQFWEIFPLLLTVDCKYCSQK